jgi:predicted DNA-binding transcriptional regulator YafY
MNKQYDTIFRHIKMLRMIPREPGEITANTLCERLKDQGFGTSIRTIQRDLIKYSTVFPINCREDTSKTKFWHFIKDSYPFDIPEMSPLSAFTFSLAESFLKLMLPAAITRQLDPHFRSAKNFLEKLQGPSWVKWSEKIRVVPRYQHLIPAAIKPDVLETIHEAIWKERQLEAVYKPREPKGEKEYVIHPLGLIFRNEVIYLVCTLWCYEDIKQLALHRFQSVKLLEGLRNVPESFNLDKYIQQGGISFPLRDKKIKLKVLFDSDAALHLKETPLSEDQKLVKQKDGKVLMTATVRETSELHWWLLGFGEYVEIQGPEYLRTVFKERSANMAVLYQ